MVLLGNKADLNAIREVDSGRAQMWAQSHGIRPYEVTVTNRDGLKDPFCYLTWRMSNPGKTCNIFHHVGNTFLCKQTQRIIFNTSQEFLCS